MINTIKKLFSVFKNMHFQSLLANGLMSVFGMITLSIVYRSLPVIDVGVYIIFMSVINLIGNLRAGFLTIALIKFFSGTTPERGKEVAGSAWLLSLIVAVIFLLVNVPTYFAASYVKDQGINLILKYFSIISIVTLPSFMTDCLVQAEKRFDRMLWLRIFTQGSYTLLVFTLAFFDKLNLTSLLYTFVASNLIASILVILLRWTMMSTIFSASRKTVLELFHFGKYSMGTNTSSDLFGVINTFIINFLIGPAALAIYNLAAKLLQLVEIPLLSFITTGMPIMSGHYNNGKKVQMVYTLKKMVGMLTIALIPVVVIAVVFANPIIHLLGGKNYIENEAPNLFRILIIIALFYPTERFFAIGVDVIHQPKINFYKMIIMSISNIIAIFIGISIYHSIYAVALASIIPLIIATYMTYKPLNNYSEFNLLDIYKVGFKEAVILCRTQKNKFFSRS